MPEMGIRDWARRGYEKGARPTRYHRLAALAAISAGISVFAGRRLCLPPALGVGLESLFTGGSIGLVVAGGSVFWATRHRRSGWVATALAVIVPVALAAAGFLLLSPVPVERRLAPATVSGVALRLPPWPAEISDGDWLSGRHRVSDPAGNGGFQELRWSAGIPADPRGGRLADDLAAGLVVRDELAARVCGRNAHTYALGPVEGTGTTAWLTWWHVNGRNHTLVSSVNRQRGSTRAVHEATLASADCRPRSAEQQRAVFPTYEAPEDFRVTTAGEVVSFQAPDGAQLAFSLGGLGRGLGATIDAAAAARPQILAAFGHEPGLEVHYAPSAYSQQTSDGREQHIWIGEANLPGQPSWRLLLGTWVCPSPERTFLALYTSPVMEPAARGLNMLARVACPK